MTAFYNEIEPFAASWLGNLIAAGHISPGTVDTRSIRDLRPEDVRDATQAHFFAGIGVWSYALKLAGIADDVPVWTGSCPCQPFSAAGKRKGLEDERHLWPAWFALIRECRPAIIFGEQVASAGDWLDVVSRDLEAEGYAFGAAVLGAHSVGAPHIRQRFYLVAHAAEARPARGQDAGADRGDAGARVRSIEPERGGEARGLAHALHAGRTERRPFAGSGPSSSGGGAGGMEHAAGEQVGVSRRARIDRGAAGELGDARGAGLSERERNGRLQREALVASEGQAAERGSDAGGVGDAGSSGWQRREAPPQGYVHDRAAPERAQGQHGLGVTGSHWSDAEWLHCKDGRLRPVEPGFEQMADGSTQGLGRVRAVAVEALEKEIRDVYPSEADAGKALSDVRLAFEQEALSGRRFGRLHGVHEAPVLLAFLRQLSDQGWSFAESVSRASEKTSEDCVRIVFGKDTAASSPRQRGLDGQQTREPSNALCVLPSILARHAQEAWGEAFIAHAGLTDPLVVGAPARVGRLRAYGNAIVAQQAAVFIRAAFDAMSSHAPCAEDVDAIPEKQAAVAT